MKNILSIVFLLLLSVTVFAQNPKLSYQSVVRDSENKLVVEQPITVTMNVLDATGTSQFEQTLTATTNRNGLVSLEFGDETAAWNDIDWNGTKIRTAVTYDGNEMVDTVAVNAVPFALYANSVNTKAIPQSDWAEANVDTCTFILSKPNIADTVNNILTTGNYVTTTMMDARGYLTSDSAVITTMQTNIANNTTNIATNAGNIATNASNITANTSAMESLANRVNTFNTSVCDSVTTCINNAMDVRGYLTADSTVITTMQNNITTNAGTMESLANRVSTFNTNVCDSVTTCINNAMDARGYLTADSTVILTMQNNITTNASNIATNASNITANTNAMESLANRVNTFNTNVCDSVTSCINNVIDARGYLTADSTVIATMQANIANNTTNIATNAGNIATNASNITTNANAIAAAVAKEKADSTTLAGRINALESATMDCNDVKACVTDTLSKYTTTNQLCNVVSTCDFSTNASLQNMLNELSSKLSATRAKLDSLSNSIDSIADIDPSHDGPAPRPFVCGDSLADHEGNMYKTMKINNWCWMAENMRCTTSPSLGTSILENPANSISYSGKKAYYVQDNAANTAKYGLLYNWCAAVDTFNTALGETSTNTNANNAVSATFYGHRRGICPEGWHLPTKNEWEQMGNYVANQPQYNSEEGFHDNAKALSSKEGWNADLSASYGPEQFWSPVYLPNKNNATGFSAYPVGYYGIDYNVFGNHEFGEGVFFWTSNENSKSTATTEIISFVSPDLGPLEQSKSDGFSVRCLRDYLTVLINDIQKTDSTASSLSIRAVCKTTKPITSATISAYTDAACTKLAGTCTPGISYSGTSLGADLTGVITGLTTVNQYWIRVTATTENDSTAREAGPFKLLDEVFTECGTSRVTDCDGNKYSTVQIGDQCWMAENLRTTTGVTLGTDCWHANNSDANDETYGLLYNWAAVMQGDASSAANPSSVQGICPEGWHVPSKAEWITLTTTVEGNALYQCGGDNGISKALSSSFGWTTSDSYECAPVEDPSTNNATGFAAAPSGYFLSDQTNTYYGFNDFHYAANFWSSTDNDDKANVFWISGFVRYPTISEYLKTDGYSVRCVYGSEDPRVMSVTTDSASTVTSTAATLYGNVTEKGSGAVSAGFKYGICTCLMNTVVSENRTATGSYHIALTLENATTYYYVAFVATNAVDTVWGDTLSFTTPSANPCSGQAVVTDHEGNVYPIVQIGEQCWMAQNLRVTTSPVSGHALAESTDTSTVASYYSKNTKYCGEGYLYNWRAAMDLTVPAKDYTSEQSNHRGLCPEGWHIPTDSEWSAFATLFVNDETVRTYFALTPVGYRAYDMDLHASSIVFDEGYEGNEVGYSFFWCATPEADHSQTHVYNRFTSDDDILHQGGYKKEYQLSVRCLRGSEPIHEMSSVTTDSASTVTSTAATLYGNVTGLGGNTSLTAGFKYGLSTTEMNTKVDGAVSATGSYHINITDLIANTTYCYTSYATTGTTDTVWGEVNRFTTLPEPTADMSVTTGSASTVTSSAATLYGYVAGLGGNTSLTAGFKYGECVCAMDSVKSINISATGSYNIALSNLAPATTYSYAAFITTGVTDTIWGDTLSFSAQSANPCSGQAIVTDHEGNQYSTVQIGDQCWMAQNLRVTTSPVSGHILIESTDTSTLASYYSQNSKYCGEGYLYNWRAAMDLTAPAKNYTSEQSNYRGLCPEGWHIPTDSEWNTFSTLFAADETFKTNFALTPVGYRAYDMDLHASSIVFDEGYEGNEVGYSFFWCATPEADHSQTHVYNRFTSDDDILHQGGYKKEYQLSVRCLRNNVVVD